MRTSKLIVVSFIVVCAIFFFSSHVYLPKNVVSGYVCKGNLKHVFSNDELEFLLSNLQMSFIYKDSPSCGFDETFSIIFLNSNNQIVSTLLIALDGCGIFQIGESNSYLEGKEQLRLQIESYLTYENISNGIVPAVSIRNHTP